MKIKSLYPGVSVGVKHSTYGEWKWLAVGVYSTHIAPTREWARRIRMEQIREERFLADYAVLVCGPSEVPIMTDTRERVEARAELLRLQELSVDDEEAVDSLFRVYSMEEYHLSRQA